MRSDLETDLQALRGDMLRFARLQLRDGALAEDVVQDAILAALAGAAGFGGRASRKTWVFAILRNKIVDVIRARSREVSLADCSAAEEELANLESDTFVSGGHWEIAAQPGVWASPEDSLTQRRFWEVFEACLSQLPAKTSRVFMMREFLGFDTDEICKELNLSASNCWVVLHRARLGLRACLEQRWFSDSGQAGA